MIADTKVNNSESVVIERRDLDPLVVLLKAQGYQVLGPVIRDSAIVYDELQTLSDLPIGWGDEQDGGYYRLRRRDDQSLFGYNLGADSWKKYVFPARLKLFDAHRQGRAFNIIASDVEAPNYAFLGVRACELQALEISDRVFQGGAYADPHYSTRRQSAFIVAVNCGQAAATCFCTSMNSGPLVSKGYDLVLTELLDADRHVFVVAAGSERGEQILTQLRWRKAKDTELHAVTQLVANTAQSMKRQLDRQGAKALLQQNPEHPRWQQVADRCLSCTNCTLVCPTCFCSSVAEHSTIDGQSSEHWRQWDSCFNADFTLTHGGSTRGSVRARYRQWLTHKLANWFDQFGSSGCVGCGRCISWCPVGIDLTAELSELSNSVEQWSPH